jgi:hypothetical protein
MSSVNLTTSALARDRIFLGSAAITLGLLSVAAWLFFGKSEPERKEKGPKRFTHVHCSACKTELPYNARLVDQECDYCTKNGKYVATVGSILEQEPPESGGNSLLVFLILAVVIVQVLAYIGIVRLRSLRDAEDKLLNRVLVCACPFCKRKIGYPATKADTAIVCSRCKTAFQPQSLTATREQSAPPARRG